MRQNVGLSDSDFVAAGIICVSQAHLIKTVTVFLFRVSIASGSTALSEHEKAKPLRGDASSGVLELHTVWLNFAAPPPVSIKRKVDFTRFADTLYNKIKHKGIYS